MKLILLILISYLIGSIPFGVIVGKFRNIDIRKLGSGNIGATNIWRNLGKILGILVFLLDFTKGFLVIVVTKLVFGNQPLIITIAAITVILGHCFPLFLKFKGGKGMSTGAGVVLGINWLILVIAFLVWLAIVIKTRHVSLGSIIAVILILILMILQYQFSWYLVFGLFVTIFIPLRHKENIKRLLNGSENKI